MFHDFSWFIVFFTIRCFWVKHVENLGNRKTSYACGHAKLKSPSLLKLITISICVLAIPIIQGARFSIRRSPHKRPPNNVFFSLFRMISSCDWGPKIEWNSCQKPLDFGIKSMISGWAFPKKTKPDLSGLRKLRSLSLDGNVVDTELWCQALQAGAVV